MRILILIFCLILGIIQYKNSFNDETITVDTIKFNLKKGTRGNTEEEVIEWIQRYRRKSALIFIIASIILLVGAILNNGDVILIGF